MEEGPLPISGAGRPFVDPVPRRAVLADPDRDDAGMKVLAGHARILAVLAGSERLAVGRVEEIDLRLGRARRVVGEDVRPAVEEDGRGRHQPHRRLVERDRDSADDDQAEEYDDVAAHYLLDWSNGASLRAELTLR